MTQLYPGTTRGAGGVPGMPDAAPSLNNYLRVVSLDPLKFEYTASSLTIDNEGDTRVLTSDGAGGIDAEENFEFDGNYIRLKRDAGGFKSFGSLGGNRLGVVDAAWEMASGAKANTLDPYSGSLVTVGSPMKVNAGSGSIALEGTQYESYLSTFGYNQFWSANHDHVNGVSDNATRAAASIQLNAQSAQGFISFLTTNTNNAAPTEAMRINGDQEVGINFGSPTERLTVGGNVRATGYVQLDQGVAPGTTTDRLYNVGGSPFFNGIDLSDHDALTNYVANEHLDWTLNQGANNIHVNNIPAVEEGAVTAHQAALTITESQVSDLGNYAVIGGAHHSTFSDYDPAEHRTIDDGSTGLNDLWSASKISSELSAVSAGIDIKDPVATATVSGDGNITLSGEQTINGVTTSSSRVCLADQTDGTQNGIWVTGAGAWTRPSDFDSNEDVTNGATVFVIDTNSTLYGYRLILTTADPIILGTTSLTFAAFRPLEFGTTAGTAAEGNDARIPTQDENDALQGTSGSPSNANRFVTNADTRLPSQDENDAMLGTDGTPSDANRYVTDSDPRLTGFSVASEANNRVITSDGAGGGVAEPNFTFDGSLATIDNDALGLDPKISLINEDDNTGSGSSIDFYHWNGAARVASGSFFGRRASLGAAWGEVGFKTAANEAYLDANGRFHVPVLQTSLGIEVQNALNDGPTSLYQMDTSTTGPSAPAMRHGMWGGDSFVLHIRGGGNDVMSLDWQGRVGIGYALNHTLLTPSKFAVTQATATQATATFESSDNDLTNPVLQVRGSTGLQKFTVLADGHTSVINSGDANGAVLDLFRDDLTPTANDRAGEIHFYGRNSVAEKTQYAAIYANAEDPTDGAEDGILSFNVMAGGLLRELYKYDGTSNTTTFHGGLTKQVSIDQNADIVADGMLTLKPASTMSFTTSSDTQLRFGQNAGVAAFVLDNAVSTFTLDNFGNNLRFIYNGASVPFQVNNDGSATLTGDLTVSDEAYGGGWNGSTEVPTKNALYDKIETLGGGGGTSGNNNEMLTDDGAGGIVSESGLTFDGTDMALTVNDAEISLLSSSANVDGLTITGDSALFRRTIGPIEIAGIAADPDHSSTGATELRLQASNHWVFYSPASGLKTASLSRGTTPTILPTEDAIFSVRYMNYANFVSTANIAPSWVSDDATASDVGMVFGRSTRSTTALDHINEWHADVTLPASTGTEVAHMTVEGYLRVDGGTATTPGLAFMGDTGSGVYSDGAGYVRIASSTAGGLVGTFSHQGLQLEDGDALSINDGTAYQTLVQVSGGNAIYKFGNATVGNVYYGLSGGNDAGYLYFQQGGQNRMVVGGGSAGVPARFKYGPGNVNPASTLATFQIENLATNYDALHIKGIESQTGNYINIVDDLSAGVFAVDENGYVAIGHNAPFFAIDGRNNAGYQFKDTAGSAGLFIDPLNERITATNALRLSGVNQVHQEINSSPKTYTTSNGFGVNVSPSYPLHVSGTQGNATIFATAGGAPPSGHTMLYLLNTTAATTNQYLIQGLANTSSAALMEVKNQNLTDGQAKINVWAQAGGGQADAMINLISGVDTWCMGVDANNNKHFNIGFQVNPSSAVPAIQVDTNHQRVELADGSDLVLNEQSDHQHTVGAGEMTLWAKDDAPNQLVATDDAGTDHYLFEKEVTLYVVDFGTALTTGDGATYFRIPDDLGGKNLIGVGAQVGNAQSTSGVVTVQLARLRAATAGGARAAVDMLSTALTIDANEWDSKDATTAAVINTSNDDVQEGDLIRVDIDTVGTGSEGLFVSLGFR